MRGSLMKLATTAQHIALLLEHTDNVAAATAYTELMHKPVTYQNVVYWRSIFIDHQGSQAKADAGIIAEAKPIRKALPGDDLGALPDLAREYSSILVIPDQHAPYGHPDTNNFLRAVGLKYLPEVVVNLGDETDFHALSFHDADPNLDSAGVELHKAQVAVRELAKLFPKQLICDSNHGSMVFRKAKHHGIPVQAIKSYRDILFPHGGGNGWSWADHWVLQTALGPIRFQHQAGNPLGEAAHVGCNLVVGHNHSLFEISYAASTGKLYWAATAGCLVDNTSLAFSYGKVFPKKPIIGCMVILNGRPQLVPMVLDSKGHWIGAL